MFALGKESGERKGRDSRRSRNEMSAFLYRGRWGLGGKEMAAGLIWERRGGVG